MNRLYALLLSGDTGKHEYVYRKIRSVPTSDLYSRDMYPIFILLSRLDLLNYEVFLPQLLSIGLDEVNNSAYDLVGDPVTLFGGTIKNIIKSITRLMDDTSHDIDTKSFVLMLFVKGMAHLYNYAIYDKDLWYELRYLKDIQINNDNSLYEACMKILSETNNEAFDAYLA